MPHLLVAEPPPGVALRPLTIVPSPPSPAILVLCPFTEEEIEAQRSEATEGSPSWGAAGAGAHPGGAGLCSRLPTRCLWLAIRRRMPYFWALSYSFPALEH